LCTGAFCGGFVGHLRPVSAGREPFLSWEEASFPLQGVLFSPTPVLKVHIVTASGAVLGRYMGGMSVTGLGYLPTNGVWEVYSPGGYARHTGRHIAQYTPVLTVLRG